MRAQDTEPEVVQTAAGFVDEIQALVGAYFETTHYDVYPQDFMQTTAADAEADD